MASPTESSLGTLVMASLLILALFFTGLWIYVAAQAGQDPSYLLPWFGGAALGIIAVGLVGYVITGMRRGGRRG